MLSSKRLDRCVLWVVSLFMCTACASLSGGQYSKYSDKQLEQIGEKFLAARDFGQGLSFLTAAEKRHPDNPRVQYLLGLGFAERGLENEALAHYQKAIALKPDYSEAYNALGGLYAQQGLTDKAEEAFKKALANPFYQNPQLALYNLGLLYEKKGETEAALKQYQEAIRLDPSYGLVYYRIGVILESMKRADQAREAYALAIKYSPELAEAHLRYGVMCYLAGEIETALYSLNRVVRLAPESSMAIEAKKYLSRMGGVMNNSHESPSSVVFPPGKLSRMDVMTEQDLIHSGIGTSSTQSQEASSEPRNAAQEPTAEASTSPEVPEHKEKVQAEQPAVPEIKPRTIISEGLEAEVPRTAATPKKVAKAKETPQPVRTESTPQEVKPSKPEAEAQKISDTSVQVAKANEAPLPAQTESASQEANLSKPEVEEPKGNEAAEQKKPETTTQSQTEAVATASPEVEKEPSPPEPQWQYIVQVGSYVDKKNAESEQQKLKRRGYNAIVKSMKHQVLGQVYVIQLKPVNSVAKASTLMTQLENGEQLKPVLIKLPAN